MKHKTKPGRVQDTLKRFAILIPVVMLPLGLWLGYRTLRGRSLAATWEMVAGIPSLNLALAFACAAASYLCLTGFDALAVRAIGRTLPYHRIAVASFTSLGIGHTVGVAVLSSGALRYRFYAALGLSAGEVGRVIVMCALTVALGLAGLSGLVLTLRPDLGGGPIGLSPTVARAIGIAALTGPLFYVCLAWRRKKPLSIRGHTVGVPDVRIAAAQVIVGTVNFALVAGTLYQLLAGAAPYAETVAAYVAANLTGLVSHVPGGIGVLEFVISSLVSHGNVVGALIAFRIVYYLVPLVLALTLLIGTELSRVHARA